MGNWVRAVPSDRDLYEGALPPDNIEFNPHCWQGGKDVAEHDDAVWPESPPGLEGQLDGNVCSLRSLPEA